MESQHLDPAQHSASGDGVEFGGQMSLDQYAAASRAAAANAETKESAAAPEPVVDSSPALASVSAEFGASDGGVDVSDLPAFTSLKGMLPSGRMRVQMDLVKLATGLPETLTEGAAEADFMSMDDAELDTLTAAIEKMEQALLRGAKDRNAMEQWLVNQDNPMQALMAAFNVYADYVGK